MKIELSPSQNLLCIDNKDVYIFVSAYRLPIDKNCPQCAFYRAMGFYDYFAFCNVKCCRRWLRNDANNGFWQKSKRIDTQLFRKMNAEGG